MEKQLPMIKEEPVVMEYMNMLYKNNNKKEFDNTQELLDYISSMEKQFEQVVNELQDVKQMLNEMQNPTIKMRMSDAIDKTQMAVDDGIGRLNNVKTDLIDSMKDCLESVKQKGKEGVVKTINLLHFKDALNGIGKVLSYGMEKTSNAIVTFDSISMEARNTKLHIGNIGRIMMGKEPKENDYYMYSDKKNKVQCGLRIIYNRLEGMQVKTSSIVKSIKNFEKSSVKADIKTFKSKNTNIIKDTKQKTEQSR
ncbi:MAG: hypothetical protein LUG60_14730 [Erysipelotrichaceae bacterium]|nr:hypothetical protein [Erysipelotrichaceae bacterium]